MKVGRSAPLRRLLPTRPLQVAFFCLLVVCIVQILWWLFDQSQFTDKVRERLSTAYDRDADAATWIANAKTHDPAVIQDLFPHLRTKSAGGDLVVDRGYRETLDEERRRHMMRYGWEGAFFIAVLAGGMWIITGAVRQRSALLDRQRNFLAAVTHELKNPLASLKLSAETFELRNVDAAGQKELSARMLRQVDRLETMVSNLLGVARLDEGAVRARPERVVLEPVVQHVVREDALSARDHGIEIAVALSDELAVMADPRNVQLILSNLLDNAVKSSVAAKGQRIDVTATSVDKRVRLDVQDDGLGFDPKDRQRLFAKFYRAGDELQRRTRGTGLGLYLVKRLCELDGGQVAAHSDGPGKGAVFSVWLPAAAQGSAV